MAAQTRHVAETSSNMWLFTVVGVTTPHSVISAAAGPRLLIRQVEYLLISQLTFISEGSSPIHHLGTRLVAYSSLGGLLSL